MKHPFWLVNDVLLILLILVIGFMVISRQKPPRPVPLVPTTDIKLPKKAISKIDLSKIYINDIFETYQPPVPTNEESAPKITMPEPPSPKPVKVPLALPAKFLEPLQITLKGVIAFTNESENIAIIQNNKNATTNNFKAGDKIEDAQLVRILKNKIILIRSNGQQETLYVNQYDAELDQQLHWRNNWSSIVQKKGDNDYVIDPYTFIQSVPNLATLIDKLNLVTVYKKGKSVGCRIGNMEPKSLGFALGFQPGDVIETINNIPATTTDSRYEIYEQVTTMQVGQTISVNLLRNQEEFLITYTLLVLEESEPTKTMLGQEKSVQEIEREKIELLRQQHQFAPTLEELKQQHKRNIVNYGNHNRRNLNVLNRQP